MAAMIDHTGSGSRSQMKKRWGDVYQLYDIKPDDPGIIAAIHVKTAKAVVNGERLFTVARKIMIIGKNTEYLYYPPRTGMTASLEYARDKEVKLQAKVTGVVPLADTPGFYRLWLEVEKFDKKISIGHQFNGSILVGKAENVEIVPKDSLVEKNGRKYLMLEVETGLMDIREAELKRRGERVLRLKKETGEKDGKIQEKP
jgi:hypothetical protein